MLSAKGFGIIDVVREVLDPTSQWVVMYPYDRRFRNGKLKEDES